MKIEEAVRLWWQKRALELSEKSAAGVVTMAKRWAAVWPGRELKGLFPGHVEGYRVARAAAGAGAAALNRERSELRQFFKWWESLEPMVANSSDRMATWRRAKEVVRKEYVVLTAEESARIRQWLVDNGYSNARHLMFVAEKTGLRLGTLLQLTGRHVVLAEDKLTVPAGMMKQRRQLQIPVPREVADLCRELAQRRAGGQLFAVSARDFRRQLRRAAIACGASPALSPHDLRRTWVARLRDAGATAQDVMQLGGWSTEGVMIRHYFGQISPERARELLERI